ncbi:DegT/DnrJ/EryC1/StrS family aminotransferase [Streptomyces benahoarensis]|uniref:DegT/DnrJ/EryC1/StrS family aminotransferase n=1 Tax=Streptomyces benahoarensis TaxID=2595054 RepID=A0A553ZLK8_9ACTN|nr:DegT/DnrJ/EryC1/StrS family aminotransferase [Streptomyces benahoarensis]TSB23359.1 DegT/DnrJ/EryC1/StrS family aminotransferase [Streptomyces benahoarensis]TSB42368.1 DegT/DnrJ/EryC1/StrS family aminotransferase [Streptomyces benahoarensis]
MDHHTTTGRTGAPTAPPRPVPFFTHARSFEDRWPAIRDRLTEVADDGKFSHGSQVGRFEQALAAWTGARFAVGVNSATDALVLALRACGLRPGDEVVVPAFSFVATASSVALAGGTPVFADIDPVGYGLDPAAADAAVTARTRMLMPVHLFCQLADMRGLTRVAERHGLTVLEDSAEAIGMRWGGVHAGLLGAGGVLSFFPTKTLGALGDAGAFLTDDPQLAETVAALRHHGRHGRTLGHFPGISRPTDLIGVNSKMDDLQAAVLLGKLPALAEDIRRRAALAAAYTERLRDTPGVLRLPTLVQREVPTEPVFYVYLIEVERRDALVAYLADHGVGTETYYPVPLHLQPCFAHLGYRRGQFPHAERACERTVALPLYPDLRTDDVDRVCDLIRRFATGRAAR